MSAPILSILIPTLNERAELFEQLMRSLTPRIDDRVRILKLVDDGEETTGRKRQRLLEAAKTPYVAFVDDDDDLSPDYFPLVLSALAKGPDVIGFKLRQFDDGKLSAESIHSITALNWRTEERPGGLPLHFRTPNHLNPVRREMALVAGYPDKTWGEDSEYSRRLFTKFPKMKEIFIDRPLYLYYRRLRRVA